MITNVDYKDIGIKIKEKRNLKGITQAELAEMIGRSVTQMSRVERGIGTVALNTLVRIANALETGIDDLLGLSLESKADIILNDEYLKIFESCELEEKKYLIENLKFSKSQLKEYRKILEEKLLRE